MQTRKVITKNLDKFEREALEPGTRVKFIKNIFGKSTEGTLGNVLRELPNSFVEVEFDLFPNFRYATAFPQDDFEIIVDSLA